MKIKKPYIFEFKKIFYKNNIRTNLFLFFIIVFIIIITGTTIVLRIYNTYQTKQHMINLSNSNLELSYNNLYQEIESAKKVSFAVLGNSVVRNTIQKENPSAIEMISAENTLYNLCSTSSVKLSCYLYDFTGNFYYSEGSNRKVLIQPNLNASEIMVRAANLDGKPFIMDSSEIFTNASGLSVVRIFKNIDSLQAEGLLIVNIPSDELSSAFNSENDALSTGFLLSSSGNNIISTNIDVASIDKYISDPYESSGSVFVTMDGQEYLLSYHSINMWDITIGTLQTGMYDTSFAINGILFSIILLSILLVWIGIFFVSNSITRPIEELAYKMSSFSPHNPNQIHTQFMVTNEIGQLVKRFNEMGSEINILLNQEIKAEKHQRHLELSLLQEQVKPHFLYNTLDQARLLYLSGQTENASQLLQALGCYYKTILSKGRATVSIEEEVNIIQEYFKILSFREDQFYKVIYQIDPKVIHLKILKFILQPLVENSIKHGISGLDDGIISVSFQLSDNNTLMIIISDNGRGIPLETIHEILQSSTHSSSLKSFGLASTLERINLYYGNDCTYTIEDNHPGTKICIVIQNFTTYSLQESNIK
ncbi:MAG: sensor histidine kinase [Suipraeoptans sp.]